MSELEIGDYEGKSEEIPRMFEREAQKSRKYRQQL